MSGDWQYFVLNVNPEPWAIGDLSVGRKAGKMFPMVGRNQQLYNYQQAIKEALGNPSLWFDGPVELRFYFWRQRDSYKTPQARTHRKHEADLTNLQKSTEDALQGVFFKNDKDVMHVESIMVQQGENVGGLVVIGIREGSQPESNVPLGVMGMVGQHIDELNEEAESNNWGG